MSVLLLYAEKSKEVEEVGHNEREIVGGQLIEVMETLIFFWVGWL